MLPFQKNLLIALALLLALQTFFMLGKYIAEMSPEDRFGGDIVVFQVTAQQAVKGQHRLIYTIDKIDGKPIASLPKNVREFANRRTAAPFVYPPHLLPVIAPLAFMSEKIGEVLWALVPVLLFYTLLFKVYGFKEHEPRLRFLIAALPLPFLAANMMSGQTGTFVAVLFLLAVWGWQRQWIGGVALGLMTVKPHLGILWPVALAMGGKWRMAGVAIVIMTGLCAAVTLWLGVSIWQAYYEAAAFFSEYVPIAISWFGKLAVAPFLSLHALFVPPLLVGFIQIFISTVAVLCVMHVFKERDEARMPERFGILAVCSLLAVPYTMTYDTPILAAALAPLVIRAWTHGWRGGLELLALVLALLIPYAQPLLLSYHLPFSLLALLVLLGTLLHGYKAQEAA